MDFGLFFKAQIDLLGMVIITLIILMKYRDESHKDTQPQTNLGAEQTKIQGKTDGRKTDIDPTDTTT